MKSKITIRLPNDPGKDLKAMSEKYRLNRSDIIGMAIGKFPGEFKKEKGGKPYVKVANLIGIISSGTPDLGEAHRKYLMQHFSSSLQQRQ